MSKHVDTDLDMAVLETLDFKPVCDSRWHEIFRWPEEAATHVATVICPGCSHRRVCTMGPTCIEHLMVGRRLGYVMGCPCCRSGVPFTAVALDPLC